MLDICRPLPPSKSALDSSCSRQTVDERNYSQEKIARSLIPHEQFLAGSYYGKYFARNLNLYLLQRRPDEWKNLQSRLPAATSVLPQKQTQATQQIILATGNTSDGKKKQRRVKDAVGDQIDAVFEKALGMAVKKGRLETAGVPRVLDDQVDAGMTTDRNQGPADVMGAMLTASSQANGKWNKKRRRVSRD
jgi:nucleolar protein 9